MVRTHEIIDHGIDHDQYFQGCGTAFTPFSHCVTGASFSRPRALEDAIEQIAQSHNDSAEKDSLVYALEQTLTQWLSEPAEEVEADDMYYFVSIRYNLPDEYETEYSDGIYDFSDADPGL